MTQHDSAQADSNARVGVRAEARDGARWICHAVIEKYLGDDRDAEPTPYETVDGGSDPARGRVVAGA